MEWALILGMAAMVAVFLWSVLTPGGAKPLSDSDLLQLAQRMGALKEAALANFVSEKKPEMIEEGDPRTLVTESGHRLLYTVSHDTPGQYVHYASASVAAGYDPNAAGEILCLWSKVLGVQFDRLVLGRSRRLVHHAECRLDEAGHRQLVGRPVETPTSEWIQAFRREWQGVRGDVKWAPANVEIRPLEQSEVADMKKCAQEVVGVLYEAVCRLDRFKRFGAVSDTAEVSLTMIVCLSLRDYFSKVGDAATQGPSESGDVWGALACAVAGDLSKAAFPVASRDQNPSAEVRVTFPRGICAYIHECLSASIARTENPALEIVRAAELFLTAAKGAPASRP
jgi:hypothetical protein